MNIDIAEWVFSVHGKLPEYKDIYDSYKVFMQETEKELFNSREELIEYASSPENYDRFLTGKLGDNLLRKYKFLVLFNNYNSFLDIALKVAGKLLEKNTDKNIVNDLINDLYMFLSFRNMKNIFENDDVTETISLKYDIPGWISSSNKEILTDLAGKFGYTIDLPAERKDGIKQIVNINKDLELSLQILYRDGNIRDYWPMWVKKK